MLIEEIRAELFSQQDEAYRAFQARLIPSVPPERIIGVRTPELRAVARWLSMLEGTQAFLSDLPHRYFEENQLHAFLLAEEKDFAVCLGAVDAFLPFVDNWATCDQMSPKVFRKHRPALPAPIRGWIASGETYTVRFGVKMLMDHFLDADFAPRYLEMAASVHSEAYYVRMMIAWYFATALAKQYEAAVPYLEEHRLDEWTHRRTIQKALESFRIPEETKGYLRSLRDSAPEKAHG